jgi:hypothetical protein
VEEHSSIVAVATLHCETASNTGKSASVLLSKDTLYRIDPFTGSLLAKYNVTLASLFGGYTKLGPSFQKRKSKKRVASEGDDEDDAYSMLNLAHDGTEESTVAILGTGSGKCVVWSVFEEIPFSSPNPGLVTARLPGEYALVNVMGSSYFKHQLLLVYPTAPTSTNCVLQGFFPFLGKGFQLLTEKPQPGTRVTSLVVDPTHDLVAVGFNDGHVRVLSFRRAAGRTLAKASSGVEGGSLPPLLPSFFHSISLFLPYFVFLPSFIFHPSFLPSSR